MRWSQKIRRLRQVRHVTADHVQPSNDVGDLLAERSDGSLNRVPQRGIDAVSDLSDDACGDVLSFVAVNL